jgi:hypothetical protein
LRIYIENDPVNLTFCESFITKIKLTIKIATVLKILLSAVKQNLALQVTIPYPMSPPSGSTYLQEGAVRGKYGRSTEAQNP